MPARQPCREVASAAMPRDVLPSRPSSAACERGAEDIRGYGDMVILINPAFEGRRYEPIYQAMTARGDCYRRYQSPALITISSQTDLATNYAFPLGQLVPSFNETFRDAEERKRAVNTPGHIDALTTHRLTAGANVGTQPIDGQVLLKECVSFRDFDTEERTDGLFAHRWTRTYDNGTELQMVGRESDRNSPFWVISASPNVIDGHSDLGKPALFEFIRYVVTDYDREIIQREKWQQLQEWHRQEPKRSAVRFRSSKLSGAHSPRPAERKSRYRRATPP